MCIVSLPGKLQGVLLDKKMSARKSKMAKIEDATWKEKIDTALSCLDINTISYLYENKYIGPDPYIKEKRVLVHACEGGNASVVQFLLDKGGNPNALNSNVFPLIIVSRSGREDIARMLIEHGADVNVHGAFQKGPLYYACENAHIGILNLLLRNGADPGLLTYNRACDNPIYVACISGFKDVVRMLVDDRDERGQIYNDYKNDRYRHPMFAAFQNKHHEIVNYFLEKETHLDRDLGEGNTMLHTACKFDAPYIVSSLITRGADINKVNDIGRTPLHVACYDGHHTIVKILLENNASNAIPDVDGNYPIDLVSSKGTPIFALAPESGEIIRTMLRHGVSLRGHFPDLHHLIPYRDAQMKLAGMLLIRAHCPDSLLSEDYLPLDLFKLICKTVVVEQGRAPFENHLKTGRERPWTAQGLGSVKLELLRKTAKQEKVDYSYKDKKQELIAKMLDHDASGA